MFNLDHQTQFVCRVDVLSFVYLQVPDHETIIKISVVHLPLVHSQSMRVRYILIPLPKKLWRENNEICMAWCD